VSLTNLLWLIVAVILAVWLAGLLLDVAGSLVHLLLIVVLALVIYQLITGRRSI
jgi:Family of unknown function (DUF5670)